MIRVSDWVTKRIFPHHIPLAVNLLSTVRMTSCMVLPSTLVRKHTLLCLLRFIRNSGYSYELDGQALESESSVPLLCVIHLLALSNDCGSVMPPPPNILVFSVSCGYQSNEANFPGFSTLNRGFRGITYQILHFSHQPWMIFKFWKLRNA